MRKSRIAQDLPLPLVFVFFCLLVSALSIVSFSSEHHHASPSSYLQWFFAKSPSGVPYGKFLEVLPSCHT